MRPIKVSDQANIPRHSLGFINEEKSFEEGGAWIYTFSTKSMSKIASMDEKYNSYPKT